MHILVFAQGGKVGFRGSTRLSLVYTYLEVNPYDSSHLTRRSTSCEILSDIVSILLMGQSKKTELDTQPRKHERRTVASQGLKFDGYSMYDLLLITSNWTLRWQTGLGFPHCRSTSKRYSNGHGEGQIFKKISLVPVEACRSHWMIRVRHLSHIWQLSQHREISEALRPLNFKFWPSCTQIPGVNYSC